MPVFWVICRSRTSGALFELRPWVADHVVDWMPSVIRLLAASRSGARALLPSGTKWRHTDEDGTEWWS